MSDLSQLFAGTLPIEVKRSIPKTLLTLFGCAVFTAIGGWSLTTHRVTSEDMLVGISCITFFGLGGLASIYMLFNTKPRVLLNEQGVWVRGWKGCPIAWDEIERVWKVEQRPAAGLAALYGAQGPKVEWVCLALKHPGVLRNGQGKLKRMALTHYRSQGMGDMYFTNKGANVRADELVAAIQSHIGGAHLSPVESLLSSSSA